MSDEQKSNEPPQSAYFLAFALAIVLLGITMFQYPLW